MINFALHRAATLETFSGCNGQSDRAAIAGAVGQNDFAAASNPKRCAVRCYNRVSNSTAGGPARRLAREIHSTSVGLLHEEVRKASRPHAGSAKKNREIS